MQLAKILERPFEPHRGMMKPRYCRMMGAIPSLAVDGHASALKCGICGAVWSQDIFQCVVQLMEFYVHCYSTSDPP